MPFHYSRDALQRSVSMRVHRTLAWLVVAGTLAAAPAASAQLPFAWRPVEEGGFGDAGNRGVVKLLPYAGQLYAATERRPGTGPAQLWRTATGEPGSWTQVTSLVPPLPASAGAISALASQTGGPAFFGTTDPAGPAVYRSSDGAAWQLANGPGSGWTRGTATAITALEVFGGAVYVGTLDPHGGELWRAPVAGAPFQKVIDFGTLDPATDAVTALRGFKGKLYAGTHRRRGGGRLWRSAAGAPGTWQAVRITERGRVRPGNSTVGDALTEFRHQLVVTTRNDRRGAEVFKSHDGRIWRVAIANGVDFPANHEFPDATVALGDLWLSTTPGPAQVWRVSSDSSDDVGGPPGQRLWGFGQANEDGFGRKTVRGGRPAVAGFDDAVYWGGEDRTRGAQVWRLDRNTIQTTEATGPGIQFSPGPLQLARDGTVALTVKCPENDPLGCEAEVSLRTQRRFRLGGKLQRLTIGETIVELDSGQSRSVRFHVNLDVRRILHRAGTVMVRAHSVAFDNAKDNSAMLVLQT
jgi:hypothetical protein